jgi:protein TonB
MAPYIPSIISVDILTLEPGRVEIPHVSHSSKARSVDRLHADPPAHIETRPAQLQKPAQLHVKEPSTVPSIAEAPVKQPVSTPNLEGNDSLDKALSTQGAKNPKAMTLPDNKGVPLRRAEAVDIHVSQSYLAVVKELIERHKEYPLMARRGRMEGTVRISCKLTRAGELRESAIVGTSGYEILDKAALRSVRSVRQFPVAPSEIKDDPFCFVAPITFHLTRE